MFHVHVRTYNIATRTWTREFGRAFSSYSREEAEANYAEQRRDLPDAEITITED